MRSRALLLALALSLLGCRRGCLTSWLVGEGVLPSDRQGPFALGGTDCPGGLLRCREGRLERSLSNHVPERCGRGESCSCPWEPAGECPGVCLEEELVLSLSEDAGRSLCATGASARLGPTRRVPEQVRCELDEIRCDLGLLLRCGRPAPLGECAHGCAATRETTVSGELADANPASILALCAP